MRHSKKKLWIFRLAAVGCGLLPLVLAEVTLRYLGWGDPSHDPSYHADPFVGFRGSPPLFVPSEDGLRLEIPPSRQRFFRPESFLASKPHDEFRVFVLGGSTVQGRPFAIETSFTTWLELALRAADSSRRWEVVNCGGVSYASYRLVLILEEVLAYQPDLIIVYTGHNEFLEERSYGHVKARPAYVRRLLAWANHSYVFGAARQAYLRVAGDGPFPESEGRPLLPAEVDALLDYQGGLEIYHYDEKWRNDVRTHFEYNLRRIVALANASAVPLWFVDPVYRLRDCPPFKSENDPQLSQDERSEWQSLSLRAARAARLTPLQAVDLYRDALQMDAVHAGTRYQLAVCLDRLGQFKAAREAYTLAKDHDVCPLRILEPMLADLRKVAESTGTPLIEVRSMFVEMSEDRILGGDLLIDHVHPTVASHQMIADMLSEELAARGWVQPREDWAELRQAAYKEHLDAIGDVYYEHGLERLRSLRKWAAGRSRTLPSGEESNPHEAESVR